MGKECLYFGGCPTCYKECDLYPCSYTKTYDRALKDFRKLMVRKLKKIEYNVGDNNIDLVCTVLVECEDELRYLGRGNVDGIK